MNTYRFLFLNLAFSSLEMGFFGKTLVRANFENLDLDLRSNLNTYNIFGLGGKCVNVN